MNKLFCALLACCFSFGTKAQQTGDFSIGFPSPDSLLTRDSLLIYFHVPASYQPGMPAKLIVGIHGIGNPQTPEQIRNYLAPTGDSISAIVMCPAPYVPQDQPRSKLVVNIAMDSVLAWYDIDLAGMYIAGYSAGSDVAAQYNLDNPKYVFKGLIWYAPGFFYQPNLSVQPDFPPTCLCFGDADPISNILGQVDAITDSFQNSPFYFFYNEIPGVMHTMEFPGLTKEMLECLRFIDDPENFVPDTLLSSAGRIKVDAHFNVLPNPSTGKTLVKWSKDFHPEYLSIADVFGKIRFVKSLSSNADWQELDLRELSAGIYFITLSSCDKWFSKRIALVRR